MVPNSAKQGKTWPNLVKREHRVPNGAKWENGSKLGTERDVFALLFNAREGGAQSSSPPKVDFLYVF